MAVEIYLVVLERASLVGIGRPGFVEPKTKTRANTHY